MSNPVLGHITCPHCGRTDATIHQEKKGKVKALYYRCIDCGTIQCRYAKGQEFIKKHGRFVTPDDTAAREAAAAVAAAEAKAEVAEAAHKFTPKPAPTPAPEPKNNDAPPKQKSAWDWMNKEIL